MWPHSNIFCFSFCPTENLPQVFFTVGCQTEHEYFKNHSGLIKLAPTLTFRAVYFMIWNSSPLSSLLQNTKYRCSCFESLMLMISPIHVPVLVYKSEIIDHDLWIKVAMEMYYEWVIYTKRPQINQPFNNWMILMFNLCLCCLLAVIK